jgi:hypothetical protein
VLLEKTVVVEIWYKLEFLPGKTCHRQDFGDKNQKDPEKKHTSLWDL